MCSMAVMGRKASPTSGVWTCPHAHRSTARGERKRNGIKKRRTHQQEGKKTRSWFDILHISVSPPRAVGVIPRRVRRRAPVSLLCHITYRASQERHFSTTSRLIKRELGLLSRKDKTKDTYVEFIASDLFTHGATRTAYCFKNRRWPPPTRIPQGKKQTLENASRSQW
jgi:hypothetical protein